jgi:N-acetyl sugar amidotransferase
MRTYQICTKTIMDTSDSNIRFDDEGVSEYYHNFEQRITPTWHTDERGEQELQKMVDRIKAAGKGKPYDCIIGLSGGIDSSYLIYLAKEKWGLRPLAFHVDAGWNSNISVSNIEALVNGLNLDLFTEVIDWPEMCDLQSAFLRAGVPDVDLPQDAAYFSALYKFAVKHSIKWVLTGANYATECIRQPTEWGGYYLDSLYIKDVHRNFGRIPLRKFPLSDILTYRLIYKTIYGMKVGKPLNFVPYLKDDATKCLTDRFGWKAYGHKHHESRFTRFVEVFWQPTKFGFDPRRAHFSSLILTGQMTREEALRRIASPELDEITMNLETEFVLDKLEMSRSEFEDILRGPNRTFRDFKNKLPLISLGAYLMKMTGAEKRLYK